jgi:hypothetical protein
MKGDVRHLLAGYATGTLTEAERKELFEAALHDPELFAEIAGEEPLRELLESAAVRAELLERIEPASPGFRERLVGWLRRPGVVAGAAAAVVLVVAVSVATLLRPKVYHEAALKNDRPAEILAPAPEAAPASAVQRPHAERPRQAFVNSEKKKLDTRAPKPDTGAVGGIGGTPEVSFAPRQAPTAVAEMAEALRPSVAAIPVAQEPSTPTLRYEVETRGPTGEFAATGNPTELKDGDVVRVRFRPSRNGFLAVHDASTPDAAPVFSGQVASGSEVVTETVTMDHDRRLEVVFVPSTAGHYSSALRAQSQSKVAGAVPAPPAPGTQFVRSVKPDATGQSAFSIELRRKP